MPRGGYARGVFEHTCSVRWGDIDAAGIAYFPQFFDYAHQAIEALFAALPGGYAGLTQQRRVGVPTVHLEADFRAPLRYGDRVRVRLEVRSIGRTSVTFAHRLHRLDDDVLCAVVKQVVVVSDLRELRPIEPPDDVRAILEAHRSADATA